MGRIFVVELEGRTYRCKFCKTHLALAEDLVSRAFHCLRGKAYLFNNAIKSSQAVVYQVFLNKILQNGSVLWISNTSQHQGAFERVREIESQISVAFVRNIQVPLIVTIVGPVPKSVNISFGAVEERMMLSGVHMVVDIFCCSCGQIVGWKYEGAREKSQKYKEGKFVLERGRIVDELDFPSDFYIDICPSMSDAEEI